MSRAGWLLLALACSGEPAPAPSPAPAPAAAAPAPAPQARVWTAADIAQLQPQAPVRQGRTTAPLAADPAWDALAARLGAVVDRYAGDPENPWAIAHGLLARGPDFRLTNGEEAVPYLFSRYAEHFTVDGVELIRFPAAQGERRIEPHALLMLKNMAEVGVPPERVVQVQGRPHTVADLYRGSLIAHHLVAEKNDSTFDGPGDLPWALQAWATWAPPGPLRWKGQSGVQMDLDAFALFNAAVLMQESRPLMDALKAGAGFAKDGKGIASYTCGGAHVLQGVSYAVARERLSPSARQAFQVQLGLWFWRLPQELKLYDRALERSPESELVLRVQRMKFLGHFLESTHKMAAMGIFTPDEAQQQAMLGAAQELRAVVARLVEMGALDRLPELRKQDEQLYLDVVGDSSHALRGLELAMGRGIILY